MSPVYSRFKVHNLVPSSSASSTRASHCDASIGPCNASWTRTSISILVNGLAPMWSSSSIRRDVHPDFGGVPTAAARPVRQRDVEEAHVRKRNAIADERARISMIPDENAHI